MAADPTVRLMAVGDLLLGDSSHFLGRGVGAHIRRYGSAYPFSKVKGIISEADIFLGNLESPLSATPGRNSWDRVYRGSAEAAAGLELAPRNIVTLANNHILEHGPTILGETRAILDGAGIAHAGLSRDGTRDQGVLRWEQNGLSFSLLCDSLVPDISGRTVDPRESEKWLLESLRQDESDVRIVSLHWGDEYITIPSPEQRRLGRLLVENGAALVLGHHPHVLQPAEQIGSGLVAYSLGNFLFDQDWTSETRLGGILDLEIGRSGVSNWVFRPTENDGFCQPRPASEENSRKAMEIIQAGADINWNEYRGLLAKESRRHRVSMKMELVRNFMKVKPDTLHFLLTKGRRPISRF